MNFSRKYLLSLIIPPIGVGLFLGLLFLTRVVQFVAQTTLTAAIILAAAYGITGVVLIRYLLPRTKAVSQALESGSHSERMSELFEKTLLATVMYWLTGGIVFATLSTIAILPTALGFGYFAITALIIGSVGISWDYFTAKRIIVEAAEQLQEVSYGGRELPLGRKIAIVFIGFFIISAAVTVELVQSRVSRSLEELAIRNEVDRFDSIYDTAASSPDLNRDTLALLEDFLPDGYDLFRITSEGDVITSSDRMLANEEVALIRERGTGNSLTFISENVCIFRELEDQSILVMTIPWAPFADIPYQIAFYALTVALFTTIFFSLATFFLSRDATGPLKKLQFVSAELAKGNFATSMNIFSDDEVGDLAKSFGETRENLRNLVGRVSEGGSSITNGMRVISGGTNSLLKRAQEQSDITERSSASLGAVRRGSESVLSAAESVTELAQDASSRATELQAAAEEVARNMDQLFHSVDKTSSSTMQMDASAREMTGRTEQLSNVGEEVLSFVSEMDSTIRELRQNAQSSAELSRQVRENAEVGGTAVNQTVEGIVSAQESTRRTAGTLNQLEKSIGQISQILNVIEDITERTNLLSLNAAIIAAQAGEHGLGFSVVADEIRELADRTRGSTKEIGGIIKAVQGASREAVTAMHEGVETVNHNVSLAQNASNSLMKILQSAGKSYDMANTMSAALEEQSTASRRLHEVSSRMTDHIAEINRATQEQAQSTKLLAEEADRVRDIALQVKNSTDEQSVAGRGISQAMERIAGDVRSIRDLLQRQLEESERIAEASRTMLGIAQENQSLAEEFNVAVNNLASSARAFESEVGRFKVS